MVMAEVTIKNLISSLFRSWQSMKERFRKKIVKNLDKYELSDNDMEIIRALL